MPGTGWKEWNHLNIVFFFFSFVSSVVAWKWSDFYEAVRAGESVKGRDKKVCNHINVVEEFFLYIRIELVLQLWTFRWGFPNFLICEYSICPFIRSVVLLIQILIHLLFQRLERNQEREKESANLEYLKNVILQFLKCRPSEREHLVPVLTTMLKLSQDEKDLVIQQARGIVGIFS